MSYKNKKNFKLLLFLTLCTVTFSTESSKKTEKVNSEKFVRYHELIHLKNLKYNSLNNPKEDIYENNLKRLKNSLQIGGFSNLLTFIRYQSQHGQHPQLCPHSSPLLRELALQP